MPGGTGAKPLTEDIGTYKNLNYILHLDVHPSWNDVATFAATLYYRTQDPDTGETEKVEVARIENRSHDHLHFDKLFTPDQEKEAFDGDHWDAWNQLKDNWKKYAQRYDRNHRP